MSMTDPIADMLTRIRNACRIKREEVDIPLSRIKMGIVEVLKREGYIKDFRIIEDARQGILRVYLKYGPDGEDVIRTIKRESKPGRRVYRSVGDIEKHRVLDGLGIAVMSTPKGILSDRECRKARVGGEYLCSVW